MNGIDVSAVNDRVREAADIVREIATSGSCATDMAPLKDVGAMFAKIVGKSLDEFLNVEDPLRQFLQCAAVLVSKRYNKVELLFWFLTHMAGHLQKGTDMPKDQPARIAVFLTALLDREKAAILRKQLIIR